MNAPSCMNPLFAEMIERHTGLKISPGNGSEGLSVPVLAESSESRSTKPSLYGGEARESTKSQLQDSSGSRSIESDSRGAQYLHYPILCMALLEENAILKQRLENLAKTDAAMFPK